MRWYWLFLGFLAGLDLAAWGLFWLYREVAHMGREWSGLEAPPSLHGHDSTRGGIMATENGDRADGEAVRKMSGPLRARTPNGPGGDRQDASLQPPS